MRTREIACLGNSLIALLSIHCTDSLFLCNRCSPVLSAAARKFGSTATSCRNSWHARNVGRSAPVRRPLHRRPSAGTNAPRPLERTRLQRLLANLALNQQPDDLVFSLCIANAQRYAAPFTGTICRATSPAGGALTGQTNQGNRWWWPFYDFRGEVTPRWPSGPPGMMPTGHRKSALGLGCAKTLRR